MKELMMRLIREEEGQGLVEYSLILVVIAIAVIAAMTGLKDQIVNVFGRVVTGLQ